MSIEAMKLALEALELHGQQYPHMVKGYCVDAIEALRAAIEQAERQEPVAWMGTDVDGNPNKFRLNRFGTGIPLYTAPPQRKEWQGLTDEEIMDACSAVWASHPIEVGQVVEAKLKEKNT